ncbi:24136_t:CDS:1, partial [Racocetra persica]
TLKIRSIPGSVSNWTIGQSANEYYWLAQLFQSNFPINHLISLVNLIFQLSNCQH